MLNTVVTGHPTENTPLLIAHGLFGSARNWGVIAKRLGENGQVVAVDMRNHGESDWKTSHGYAEMAEDLLDVINQFGGQMDVLGHSMGGKAAMILAVRHAPSVRRLVVADIAPSAYNHTQIHLVEAMQGVHLDYLGNRADAQIAMASTVPEEGVRAFLLQSLDIKARKWRLNLDVLADEMHHIIGFPEIEGEFDGPSLFLTGAESTYVTADHRPEIKRLFPKARFAKIPGAGHWLHAEKPREFEAAVRAFLDAG